jgi:signal transduction histidine kinase
MSATTTGPGSPPQPGIGSSTPLDYARQLKTLTDVARSLSLSGDLESLAREVLNWTQAFIPGAVGRFWSIAEDGQTRTLVASVGLRRTPDEPSLIVGQGLGGLSVNELRTQVSLDVIADPRFVKKDWARAEGLVSSIMLPLAHRQRVYGNLSIFTRTRHPFDEWQIQMLEAFAALAAAALANGALVQESIRKTERLESLNRVNASLASSLEAEDTLQLIVEEAPKLLRLDGGALRLVDGDELVLVREQGLPGRLMIKQALRIDESLSGRVAAENRPIIVDDLEADDEITPDHKMAIMAEGAKRWIGVPVRHQYKLIGVLVAVGKQPGRFSEDDIALLSAFADHAAIALENSRLYSIVQQELQERRKAEDALREHQEHLEEVVRERTANLLDAQQRLVRKERLATLGQLTASVSHELRTPLGTIQASLNSMEKTLGRGEQPAQEILDRAVRNIERCDAIISDLLDYTGTPRIRRVRIPLDPWLDALLDELMVPDSLALRRQLDSGAEIDIDEGRFRRVVFNLYQNAVQAIIASNPQRETTQQSITVLTRCEPERVVVEVADTGPGISAEPLHSIFEPLFTTKGFGMGLGLAIVQQVMELHDGGIEVAATSGHGTRMLAWLPRVKALS